MPYIRAMDNGVTNMTFTALEIKVLTALFDSSRGNGHDFGFTEDARSCVDTARQLAGVIASLVKKDVIIVYDTQNLDGLSLTQFTFKNAVAVARAIGADVADTIRWVGER